MEHCFIWTAHFLKLILSVGVNSPARRPTWEEIIASWAYNSRREPLNIALFQLVAFAVFKDQVQRYPTLQDACHDMPIIYRTI